MLALTLTMYGDQNTGKFLIGDVLRWEVMGKFNVFSGSRMEAPENASIIWRRFMKLGVMERQWRKDNLSWRDNFIFSKESKVVEEVES